MLSNDEISNNYDDINIDIDDDFNLDNQICIQSNLKMDTILDKVDDAQSINKQLVNKHSSKITKIKQIQIKGFLSFDMNSFVNLNNLNIITGANGIGKTNFIKIIDKVFNECNDLKKYINFDYDIENKFIKIMLELNDVMSDRFTNVLKKNLYEQLKINDNIDSKYAVEKIDKLKPINSITLLCEYNETNDYISRKLYIDENIDCDLYK